MRTIALFTLLVLTACGADAPPVQPGIQVSGEAALGVTNNPEN